MTGYYKSKSDDSIYHVYRKGFDLYAQCVQCKTREENLPFPMIEKNLVRMINWGTWEITENPDVERKTE